MGGYIYRCEAMAPICHTFRMNARTFASYHKIFICSRLRKNRSHVTNQTDINEKYQFIALSVDLVHFSSIYFTLANNFDYFATLNNSFVTLDYFVQFVVHLITLTANETLKRESNNASLFNCYCIVSFSKERELSLLTSAHTRQRHEQSE